MRVLLCMDSWKGSMTALEACQAAARGLRAAWPEVGLLSCPIADGGEGTLDAVDRVRPGKRMKTQVAGPMPGQRVEAEWLWWPERGEALVELAQASGLLLVPAEKRNPLQATTYGTGELLKAALFAGATRIYLTVGGSATVDGGLGMAAALGWQFFDAAGLPCRDLLRVAGLRAPKQALPAARVEVLCDVTNPLLGPTGAAAVFAPQKGADPQQVDLLEEGLAGLARLWKAHSGLDLSTLPGMGAAGGVPAAARVCLGAELVPGIDRVIDLCGLREQVKPGDWIVTGEGCLDTQSLGGKVISGIARLARERQASLAVLAGRVDLAPQELASAGILLAEAASPPQMPLADAVREAAVLAEAAAGRLANQIREAAR